MVAACTCKVSYLWQADEPILLQASKQVDPEKRNGRSRKTAKYPRKEKFKKSVFLINGYFVGTDLFVDVTSEDR